MTPENLPGRYTILREVGRGPVGTVYAARDGATGATVALKVVDPALFSEPDAKLAGLFMQNARSAARLRHRNIVRSFDAGEAGRTAFVATELVEGESLRQMLDERPLSIARAIRIFDDIASALAYAHEEGMVHRGVKPSNIIVSREGVAKIGDFGTGQIGEAALRYMSPEQVRRDPVDHRSDLFSLGAVFYEMLTRRAPFEGNSAEQIRQNILHAEPPPPSTVNPHVPGALDAIVSRMLARNPDDRFSNGRILLRDLQRLEEELGLGPGAGAAEDAQQHARVPDVGAFHAPDAPFMKDREPRPEQSSDSRSSLLAALALMLALLSIGLTVFLYYSPDLSERPTPASRMPEAPTPPTAAAASPPTAPTPVTEAIKEPATEPGTEPASEVEESSGIASAPSPLLPQPLVEEPEEAVTGDTAPTPQPGGMAKLIIAVSPRGELYIDDEHYGTTPPITTLELAPGMHRIEVRSGSRKPYVTYMTVNAGEERRIRHDFNAKPSRPPG